MRFQNWGCRNRPFLRIIVSKDRLPVTREGKYFESYCELNEGTNSVDYICKMYMANLKYGFTFRSHRD